MELFFLFPFPFPNNSAHKPLSSINNVGIHAWDGKQLWSGAETQRLSRVSSGDEALASCRVPKSVQSKEKGFGIGGRAIKEFGDKQSEEGGYTAGCHPA